MTTDILAGGDDSSNTQIDPNVDYFQELVGEGKKFKTPQDLAKGKWEADNYVKMLERKLDDMRTDNLSLRNDNTTRAKLEELVDRLQDRQQVTHQNTQTGEPQNQPQYDPNQLNEILNSKLQEYENTKRQQENSNTVVAKLKERFGNNYQNAVKDQISQLGMTDALFNDLARNSPQVLFKTLGLDQPQHQESFQSPPRTTQRNDSFAPRGGEKRTWQFYQNMKKNDYAKWSDPKTSVQMYKDAAELGSAFEDGDFHS